MKKYIFIPLCALIASCTAIQTPISPEYDAPVTIRLKCDASGGDKNASTKSSFLSNCSWEDDIDDYEVYVFKDGEYVQTLTGGGDDEEIPSLRARIGEVYDFYAIANETLDFDSEEDLLNSTIAIEGHRSNIPMAAMVLGYTVTGDDQLCLPLERLYARYCVSLDKTALADKTVRIKSMTVRKPHALLYPFDPDSSISYCDDEVQDSQDYASESDLATLNGGGSIILYVPENRSENLDEIESPDDKIPSNFCECDGNRLAYLEVTADINARDAAGGEMKHYSNVTYRCMLGGDDTSDCAILRNCSYELRFCLTEEGCLTARTWKVEPGSSSDIRILWGVRNWYTNEVTWGERMTVTTNPDMWGDDEDEQGMMVYCKVEGVNSLAAVDGTVDFDYSSLRRNLQLRGMDLVVETEGFVDPDLRGTYNNQEFRLTIKDPSPFTYDIPFTVRDINGSGLDISAVLTVVNTGCCSYWVDGAVSAYAGQVATFRLKGRNEPVFDLYDSEGSRINESEWTYDYNGLCEVMWEPDDDDGSAILVHLRCFEAGTTYFYAGFEDYADESYPIDFTIKSPLVQFDKAAYTLEAIGFDTSYSLTYVDEEGNPLTFDNYSFNASSVTKAHVCIGTHNGTVYTDGSKYFSPSVSMSSSGKGSGRFYTTDTGASGIGHIYAYPASSSRDELLSALDLSVLPARCGRAPVTLLQPSVSGLGYDTFHNWAGVSPALNTPTVIFKKFTDRYPGCVYGASSSEGDLILSASDGVLKASIVAPGQVDDPSWMIYGRKSVTLNLKHKRSGNAFGSVGVNLDVVCHLAMGLWADESDDGATYWLDFAAPLYDCILQASRSDRMEIGRNIYENYLKKDWNAAYTLRLGGFSGPSYSDGYGKVRSCCASDFSTSYFDWLQENPGQRFVHFVQSIPPKLHYGVYCWSGETNMSVDGFGSGGNEGGAFVVDAAKGYVRLHDCTLFSDFNTKGWLDYYDWTDEPRE